MESQLDKLIVDFAQAVRKLAGATQSISVNIDITESTRLSWTANIVQSDEEQTSYTKQRSLAR